MENYKPMNILITGGTGFIGSHVVNLLTKTYPSYKVIVLDKLDYCSSLRNLSASRSPPSVKFVKGDICCADLIKYILPTEKIDAVMHFAAQTHVDNSFGNSFEFVENNVYGTCRLLECCKVYVKLKRFVHVSTDEVYGESDETAIIGNHENSQLYPTNPYAALKAGAEMLVMAYGRSYDLPVIITRGNNVYGPHQYPEKLVPKFILLAMNWKSLPIQGDGSNVRSFLYCDDVAEAFDVILHKGEVGHVYNIGISDEKRVIDVAVDIWRLFSLDSNVSVKFVEDRPFNNKRYFLDSTKLKNLGWVEKTKWEDGLRRTMDWYARNQDWWDDASMAYHQPYPRMMTEKDYLERESWDSSELPSGCKENESIYSIVQKNGFLFCSRKGNNQSYSVN